MPETGAPHYFCTYFDRNYMTRGLALYESLKRECRHPFLLWVLCFDDETRATLAALNLPEIRLVSEQEFEAGDEELQRAKTNRSRVEYYWTCSPSLPLYIFNRHPEVDILTYLDADLYFFSDPQPIFDEFGGNSILAIEHRYTPELAGLADESGKYNVGLLSFRPDENGLACLRWWRERCIEWCYARYENGKYGDQFYLDEWPNLFNGFCSLQHKGAGLAPWNYLQYHLQVQNGKISVDGQPLIFFHYHGFRYVHEHIANPVSYAYKLTEFTLWNLFFPYAAALTRLSVDLKRPLVDPNRRLTWIELLSGLFERRMFLTNSTRSALTAWNLAFWAKDNPERITTGFDAFDHNNMGQVQRSLLLALFFNPLQLGNIEITSRLAKSIVGEKLTRLVRAWKHRRA